MKKIFILFTLLAAILGCSKSGPYDESADPNVDIQQALSLAKSEKKPLIIIFGANWCSDCQALDKDLTTGVDAQKIADEFKLVKVNVGNFDTNLDVANKYGNPISGGIPGAAMLTSEGMVVYVTKPGELATVRYDDAEGLYQFFKKHFI